MSIILSPSILSADFANLGADVLKIEKAGAEYVHIDVMDGIFVPNITIGIPVVKDLRKVSKLVFDVHLMIVEPQRYVDGFADAGADIITVHYESTEKLKECIAAIKARGLKAGVSIKPNTPVDVLNDIVSDVDMVLIMSVEPGFGGQSFINGSIEKIRQTKELIDSKGLNIDIEVDGGITADNVGEVVKAGANVIVAGSAIFGAKDLEKAVYAFKTSSSVKMV